MAKGLLPKQLKFAQAVAMGKSKAKAYAEAGYGPNSKMTTKARAAKTLSDQPQVKAAIEHYTLQLLPAPSDMRAVYEHGLATMIELTRSKDDRVRATVAQWLCQEAKEQEEKRKVLEASVGRRKLEGDESILAELRGIYKQAAIEASPLVENVAEHSEPEVSSEGSMAPEGALAEDLDPNILPGPTEG